MDPPKFWHHRDCKIIHLGDCFPAKTPPLSRQDATLSEQEYPIRHKAKVWFKENYPDVSENKENIPPPRKIDEKEDDQHDVVQKA